MPEGWELRDSGNNKDCFLFRTHCTPSREQGASHTLYNVLFTTVVKGLVKFIQQVKLWAKNKLRSI